MNPPYQPSSYQKGQSSALKNFWIIAILAFVFFLGWNAGASSESSGGTARGAVITNAQGQSEAVDMSLFWGAWSILTANYVDPHKLDTQKMVYGAIRGMVAALEDPYTAFMDPVENRQFHQDLSGSLEGVGIEITVRNQLLTVVSPLKDSPAKAAGIQPEDIIYKIDGAESEGMSVDEAARLIRGKSGTSVTLTILREGATEPLDIAIVRKEITISSVESEMKEGFGYISINTFGDTTLPEFDKAVNELLPQNPQGIILDFRYNGGGYLEGAIDIASDFLSSQSQKIVTIKKRNPQEDEAIYANGRSRLQNLPVAVLINGGSASASEIVAGALQDHKRAVIVGEKSFGKGTVQTVENLVGGSSLRVTIAKWFTPNDRNISETGIMPDVEVARTPEQYESGEDPQLDAAVAELKKMIEN